MAPRPRLARHPIQRNISWKSWGSDMSDRCASYFWQHPIGCSGCAAFIVASCNLEMLECSFDLAQLLQLHMIAAARRLAADVLL